MNCSDFENIKMVWIDLDDTLIDFRNNSRAALRRIFQTRSLDTLWPCPEAWTEAYEGHNRPLWVDYAAGRIDGASLRMERFRRPLVDAGMTDSEARALSAHLDSEYLDFLAEESSLLPGAREMLVAIRAKGLRTGILSNGFADVQHRKIAHAGLDGLIDVTVLSDDIGVNKPHPELFAHAQSRTPWPSSPCAQMMVGDNPSTDVAGALNAGWKAIWFNPAGLPGTPSGALAVTSLAEIARLFD